MKKFILKLILFSIIILSVDFTFGIVCTFLNSHAKEGTTTGTEYHIAMQSNEEIIMMGSSRMHHHYIPQMFQNELNVTAYNAGIDGNGIILAYGYLSLILERYTPKMVIYDITGFDMYVDGDCAPEDNNLKYLGHLKEYYSHDCIKDIFNDIAPNERYKMLSHLYQYNTKAVRFLGDAIHAIRVLPNGYSPLYGVLNYEPDNEKSGNKPVIDKKKLEYVNHLIDLCERNNIDLVFAASPRYKTEGRNDYNDPIKEICKERDIEFIDYYSTELFNSHREYFQDQGHLNDTGAKVYTELFIKELKERSII